MSSEGTETIVRPESCRYNLKVKVIVLSKIAGILAEWIPLFE